MTIKTRKIAALVSAAALLGSGVGIAGAAGGAGKGGHPKPPVGKIATALGVTNAELRAALEESRPTGERPGPEQFAADIASKLGVEESAVQEILEANKPERPQGKPKRGARPPKPDHSKLIAALADGLGIDQAAVQSAFDELDAAHEAEHTAREQAMYASVAEALGKTTSEVQAAFEANRPAKPAS
jgi:hypothetical protein